MSSKSRRTFRKNEKSTEYGIRDVPKNVIEKPTAIAFEFDSKPIAEPKRKRANVVIPAGQDLEKELDKNLNKRVNNFNAEDYKKYKGKKDPKANFHKSEPVLNADQELNQILKEHLTEGEMYDGDHLPGQEDEEYDPGWERYKKVHNIEQDANAYRKYRKKVLKEQQLELKREQQRNAKLKNPSEPKEEEIKFTKVNDLKKLTEEQAVKFLENFVPRMNNMLDYG